MQMIDFQTDPSRYRHWRIEYDGDVAYLIMDVDPAGGLSDAYELKLNSYDLAVDIELSDAIQRLRFEHPEVHCVVIKSGKDNVFCAGANIRMLGKATHGHKVNFCKFTNETRLSIEDATSNSGQTYMCAVNGSCAGGGYELALATDHIMLVDDRRSTVSLPETPLLAVLPGTGGLTRVTDKRKVRRDRADFFCSTEEGVRGAKAVDWRLVDEVVPTSKWSNAVAARAHELAKRSDRPSSGGIQLTPLQRKVEDGHVSYSHVDIEIDRDRSVATLTVRGPAQPAPASVDAARAQGDKFWPLTIARELEDAILHLRVNEPSINVVLIRTDGNAQAVIEHDEFLAKANGDWLMREVRHYLKRVFKRIDLTAKTFFALVEPGSCFAGTLAELAFAADRTFMLIGTREGDNRPPATLTLGAANFGFYPMGNGLSRLQSRFLGEPESLELAKKKIGVAVEGEEAAELGLVTFAYEDFDWDDELRVMTEERASHSPDSLTGMEANLRFAGPETMETKIFGRLTAWQNWIFQRPNSVGEHGALKLYGTGVKATFDKERI